MTQSRDCTTTGTVITARKRHASFCAAKISGKQTDRFATFTTVDPIRDGNNWFSYVMNDPVNYVDAWGLSALDGGKGKKKNIIDEFFDIFSELSFGIKASAGINIPGKFSLDIDLDLLSVKYENGKSTIETGVTTTITIGSEPIPVGEITVGKKKIVEQRGGQTAFDLFTKEAEPVVTTEVNTDFTAKGSALGITVKVKPAEVLDFIKKL